MGLARSLLLAALFAVGCGVPSPKPEKGRSNDCEFTLAGALQGTIPCSVTQYFDPKSGRLSFNLVYVYGEVVTDPGGSAGSYKHRAVVLTLPATGVGEFPIVDFDRAISNRAIASSEPIAGAMYDDFYPSGRVGFNETDFHRFNDQMKGKVNLVSRAPYVANFEFTSEGKYGRIRVRGRFRVESGGAFWPFVLI